MNWTKERLEPMGFTETFISMIKNVDEEVGYRYEVKKSVTTTKLYKCSLDDVINEHINHISEDYLIEDRLELVESNGYIKGEMVVAELLFRKKITSLEKMGITIRYADEDLIKEKFGDIKINSNYIYRLATYKATLERYIYSTDEKIIGAHMCDALWELSQSDDFRLVCIKGHVKGDAIAEMLLVDINGRDIK